MSLLLDALKRTQSKARSQASEPTEPTGLAELPPIEAVPLAMASPAPSLDEPAPAPAKPIEALELALDPMGDAAPAVTPEPVAVPVPPPSPAPAPPSPPPPPTPSAPPSAASLAPPLELAVEPAKPAPAAATAGSASGPSANSRGRRLLRPVLSGLGLAVLAAMGWQHWQTTRAPGLAPAESAPQPPEPELANPVNPANPANPANPPEMATEQEVALKMASEISPANVVKPAVATEASRTQAPATAAPPASSAASSASPAQVRPKPEPAAARTPAPATEAATRPAQLVRSQAQSQLQGAWSALRQGDAARAQTLYEQVLASRPGDPDATLGLAVSLHRQQQLEAAWLAYQHSLQVWPDNETARAGMLAILSESDLDTAESRLQEWVQSRPRDADAQAALGSLLGRQERWAQALGPLSLAQALAPDSAPHAFNLAVALDQLHRYDDALQMYRHALQMGAAGVSPQAVEQRITELQEGRAR